MAFCQTAGVCGICKAESAVVNYASSRIDDGVSGSCFRAHMGALKQWLSLLCPALRDSVWIAALEASVRVTHPDRHKYTYFYRLEEILGMLRSWGPTSTLSVKLLRTRALTLLRLDLFSRSKDIERIRRGNVRGQSNPLFLPDGQMGLHMLRPKGIHSRWEWADGQHSIMFYIES